MSPCHHHKSLPSSEYRYPKGRFEMGDTEPTVERLLEDLGSLEDDEIETSTW